MPVDAAFARQDMAVLYDSFNAHGADGDFYLSLAQGPCRILDLGCGTGSVALRLASLGHTVTGLDPAPGMLGIARQKDKAGTVRWISGDARDFALGETFDLIIMTGHVFQVFLDDAETLAVLSNARGHLADGGRLVFESRNPPAQEWQGWTEEQTREQTDVPGIGPVEVYYQVREAWGDFVRFDAVFTLLERRAPDQRKHAAVSEPGHHRKLARGRRPPLGQMARRLGRNAASPAQHRNHRHCRSLT